MRSAVFPAVLPPVDLFSVTFGIPCLVAAQVYSPSVDDGYYATLRRLPVGQHQLSIRGTDGAFSVDAFYTLNVVKTVLGIGESCVGASAPAWTKLDPYATVAVQQVRRFTTGGCHAVH